jgi:hypothetical protein
VTDTVTGLIWLQNAYCLGSLDWATANQAAASLKTGDCGGTFDGRVFTWGLAAADERGVGSDDGDGACPWLRRPPNHERRGNGVLHRRAVVLCECAGGSLLVECLEFHRSI